MENAGKIRVNLLIGNQWRAPEIRAWATPRGGIRASETMPPCPTPCSISALPGGGQ